MGKRTTRNNPKVGTTKVRPHRTMVGKKPQIVLFCLLLLASVAAGQTFELGNQNSTTPNKSAKKKPKAQTSSPQPSAPSSEGSIGWGSGIEVARDSRAAQQALQRNDYSSAVMYASRAANAAPQNTGLWFLLGYSARLAGQYQVSINAYSRGLRNQPGSIQGLSGLAQTYVKMGRQAEAKEVLQKVLAANPRSVNDLQLAGEISLSTDPSAALDLLKRAEALQPSARGELLIARAYQRLNQPQASKQYLDRAQARAPRDPNVLRAVASFYRDAKQYDLAIATLQKAVSGKDPGALSELGYTYQLAGKKKQAAETYAKAASMNANDTGLQLSAAQALVNVGQLDRAATFLQHAEARDANNYRLHAIRGQIASLQARNQDAIREYRIAIEHLPDGVPEGPLYPISLHLSLSELYRGADDQAGADRELAVARTELGKISGVEDSSKPEFLRLRASVEAASNDVAAAEKDLKEALALDPGNLNIMLSYANLLWKINRKPEAMQMYSKALEQDPTNHSALTAMGYLSREIPDQKAAEKYFTRLSALYPNDYVPFIALGDLYTSTREFARAQTNYEKAHQLAPNNPLVVSGGTNSALEAHELPVAKRWLDRADANPVLNQSPQVMRERERYLTWTGHYEESAALGYKVLEKLPRDPEAPVYLAYDLLFLNKYDEAAQIVEKYQPILPRDKDLRLIAGYVHVHSGQLREAVTDFSNALELDPKVPTAYMNRGFVLNDLKEGDKAAKDFETAIKLRPNYAEAHLGLGYAYLQLHRAKPALKEINIAAKLKGESKATHLARAEAYRQQILLRQAEAEYRAALKIAPNDVTTRLALADTLYRLHRYDESIDILKSAIGLSTHDDFVYAQMARAYAQLHRRDEALKAIAAAEKHSTDTKVFIATGEALLILGDHQAAMDHYARALESSDADRVEVRLALARLFAHEGRRDEAQQQIALGFAEARVGEANPITPQNLLEAADVLMAIEQFDLAKKYFERAQAEGADQEAVAVGLANAYLALGETESAGQLLQSMGNTPESSENYEYLVALGNVYRQQQDTVQALSAFARANRLVMGNESTERAELDLAGQEGRQITNNLSVQSEISLNPIFEDINIYTTDAKLLGVTNPALLPTPRSSIETRADARYRIHLNGWPAITGLVAERNARGQISFPSELLIQDRNTYDTIFNGGINPVFHLGSNTIALTPGIQYTIRRDTISPVDLNQNLFRQFLYLYTSAFGNWVSVSGSAVHEAGPFTERTDGLHSRDLSGHLNFLVGRPWGKTAFLTGYSARDVLFRPLVREYYTTSTYVGLQRKFGQNLRASIFAEYLRSWRVQDNLFAIAQAIRPAFDLQYTAGKHWSVQASGSWSKGEGFHAYDNVNNQFLVSYVRSVQRPLNDGLADVPVTYPLRFSFGLAQQTFYNFTGGNSTKVLPIVRLTLF